MIVSSKKLYEELFLKLVSPKEVSEKQAIILFVLQQQYGLTKSDVIAGKDVHVIDDRFNNIVDRLNQHEPVQYVLGETDFYSRTFFVNPAVLIPRPETELLIDLVKGIAPEDKAVTICDIGTGSGCIAITLALEIPMARVIATDISQRVLNVAMTNNSFHRSNVSFYKHDILKELIHFGPVDIIVSNPPYIAQNEKAGMPSNVVMYEPHTALFVEDADPLIFYKSLAKEAMRSLYNGGYLITEINERFGKETVSAFTSNGLSEIKIVKDLDSKDRFVMARKL